MNITQRAVKAAKPPANGNHIHYDDQLRGFGLRVTAANVNSFVLNYSIAGRERRFTIGRWPEWSADAARAEAPQWRGKIAERRDVTARVWRERTGGGSQRRVRPHAERLRRGDAGELSGLAMDGEAESATGVRAPPLEALPALD
jgi:hypothetical protein